MLDTPEFQRGRVGEMLSAEWLKQRGWFVVPSYDYSGKDDNKPPRLQGARLAYAIPDLDIARDGRRVWVEVKTKAGPTYHRITGVFEHGISRRLHLHYQEVQTITGNPVWLFIVEEEAELLLGRQMDALGEPRIYGGGKMGQWGMSFWPRERFRVLSSLQKRVAA